jgi:molybdenum cofactor biosynthesis protein B
MADNSHGHGHPAHGHSSPSHAEHKARGPSSLGCGIITCSDTRTPETDKSGQLIHELLSTHGHRVEAYHVVKDEPQEVRNLVEHMAQQDGISAIIINGGTGISQRDTTFEAIASLLEKRLDGFGEIFRYLSYKDIGSAAMLSRSTAGLYRGRVLFSIPGSSGAVRLAMEALILQELPHIVGELSK